PARTWEHLMSGARSTELKVQEMREAVKGYGVPLALTESHFAPPGRNRSDVLLTWAAGVANARVLNVHERNGDLLKIATLADMIGTRWTNVAIMVPMPEGSSYLLPVGRVMSLFGRHVGEAAVAVVHSSDGLDVTASRSDERLYLHVVNVLRTAAVAARPAVAGRRVRSARAWQIALDPMLEVDPTTSDQFAPRELALPTDAPWRFPAASVTAVELETEEAA
ncbi:MAG: alpha-L-arabinofuranosidase C-terminal domain-containing protein, partial [Anaerolineae bacterium]|nr:alpha-L-arabinofuranosidase C-terminal domain-containing protein [Anaerolineae bacterium]